MLKNLNLKTRITTNEEDLKQILDLQQQNLKSNLLAHEAAKEGFVTVKHDLKTLNRIGGKYGHFVSCDQQKVVAYALLMLPEDQQSVPVLIPFFEMLNKLTYDGRPIREQRYCVIGQICVDKKYRGNGVVKALYNEMYHELSKDFRLLITEIATSNHRSLRAHQNAGFQGIHQFKDTTDDWQIILKDWQK